MSCGQIIHNGETLDVGKNFLRLTRNVEELTDLAQIKVDGALGFSMPDTEKNRKYLRKAIDPHLKERERWLEVEVHAGGHVTKFTRLFVLEYRRGNYEVELRLPETHWVESAKNLLLKDIEIEDIELSEDNVLASWDNAPYADGDSPWVFPLAYYGTFMRGNYVTIEDFRPFIYDLALLQKGFCQLGWDFRSPILETNTGRGNASYLISNRYFEDSDFTSDNTVIVDFERDGVNNVVWDVIQDPGNLFTPDNIGRFERVGVWDIELEYTVHPNSQGEIFSLVLIRENFNGNQVTVISDSVDESPASNPVTKKSRARVQLALEDFISISISSGFSFMEGRITFTPVVLVPTEGSIYKWADMVDPELTLYDFLIGKQHQFNALIDENSIEKQITLYPPKSVEWGGEEIEGYIQDAVNDLNGKKVFDSENINSLDAEQDRNIKLMYASAEDPTIDDDDVFSKIIDLGVGREGTEENENPLFEPTVLFAAPNISNGGYAIFLPALTDNDDGEYSTKIGPRNILVGERRIWWSKKPGSSVFSGTSVRLFALNNIVGSTLMGWMKPHYQIQIGGGEYEFPANIVYGDTDDDLGSKFWLGDLLEKFKNVGIEALVNLNKADFFKWSFREQYIFDTLGKLILCRADGVNDFQPCSEISTPVNFRPLRLFLDCEIEPVVECNNFPTLDIDVSENCWTWEAGGEFVETPTITEEYRLVGDTVWTEGTTLCDPSSAFYIRARFEFENCPDLFIVRFVDGCGNSPVLIFTFDGNCMTIEVGGTFISEVSSSTITYSIDGGEPQLYTEPVCDFEGEICASALVEYEGNCPDSEIEGCYSFDISECDNNDPAFTINEENGIVSFSRDETLVLTPQIDQFHYKLKEDAEWRIWAGEPIIGCELWAKRVVIFCDTCPSLCSDVEYYEFIQGGVNFEVYQIGNTLKAFGACSYQWYEGETLVGENDTIEVDCSETITVKGICGECESEKIIEFCDGGGCPTIETEPVDYVPEPTGNENNLCQFVEDPKGQSWFIDANGNAKLLSAVAGIQKFTGATGMFVTITNFDLPSDQLTADEISKKLIVNRQTNVQIYDESYTIDTANNRVYFGWQLENEVVEVILLN